MGVHCSQLSFSFAWGLGTGEMTASRGKLGRKAYLCPPKAEQLQHALKVASEPVGSVSGDATFVWQALQAIKNKDHMQGQLEQRAKSKEQCPKLGRLSGSCVIDSKDAAHAVHPCTVNTSQLRRRVKEDNECT